MRKRLLVPIVTNVSSGLRGPGTGEWDRAVTKVRLAGWVRPYLQGLIYPGNRFGFDPNSNGKSFAGGYGQTRSGSLQTSQPSVRRLQEDEQKGAQD